jgi:DNA modification methylase
MVVWCDLNDEQRAIERALDERGITYSSLYGSQSIEEREALLADWRERRTAVFLSKTSMYGAGVNLQQAHRMIYAGVHFKFYEVIQGVHRIHRFGQNRACSVDFIYTSAEREIRRSLERKWLQHDEQRARMSAVIREFGLSSSAMAQALQRAIGVDREEAAGDRWRLVKNDCVVEMTTQPDDSIDLIVTSIPFSTQYEYSPSYNDFGHTDDNGHFWEQMDYLIPELFRALKPGRVAAIHVKDRIVPTGLSGLGFQVVQPFSDETVAAFRKHGFGFLARKTVVTDVVRENNQTYRLGWSEQCKDGTKMGAGMPEYVLLFRKPPTDRSNGYADDPVRKEKPLAEDHGVPAPFDKRTNWKKPIPGTGYSRSRWQLDAHGFTRSSGNRLISSDELRAMIGGSVKREDLHKTIYRLWRERSSAKVYDFKEHEAIAEEIDRAELLPATFMLLPPHSWHDDVWSDVARMRTLNGEQHAKGREMHLCPLQFDIVDRLITQFSMKGEVVLDPFAGLGTVPRQAVLHGRRGLGIELSRSYWLDSLIFLRAAERETETLTLFDVLEAKKEAA